MIPYNEIIEIIFKSIDEINLQNDTNIPKDENTKLFGSESELDSLSLVNLIVDLESTFSNDYELDISLTDDRAMMREVSPFDSIKSLAEYIDELVCENCEN